MRIVVLGGTVLLGTKHLEDVHEAPPRNPGMLTDATGPSLVIEVPDSSENATVLELVTRTPPAEGTAPPLKDETEASTPAHGMPDPTAPEQFRMDAFYRTALAAQAGWD